MAPDASKLLEVKVRDYVLLQSNSEITTSGTPPTTAVHCGDSAAASGGGGGGNASSLSLSLIGLGLHGATFNLGCCHSCLLSDLEIIYPTYNKHVPEMNAPNTNCTDPAAHGICGEGHVAKTALLGDGNTVVNVSLARTNNGGLAISGDHNHIENILVEDTDWLGTLTYVPVALSGNHNALLHSTVRRFGNAGVVTSIPNTPPKPLKPAGGTQHPPQPMKGRKTEVGYCHIHHGGLIGKDSAALYTGGWVTAGLEWHHNWIHSATEKCARADDQSRNMSVHHNVIFDCGLSVTDTQSRVAGLGLVLKGNGHLMYANTVWGANKSEVCMPSCVERLKSFRPQFPRQVL